MPLVAHVSPCGRLLNERGQRGGDVAPVKWTFNYLPWLNTTQSECTQYRSPSSFTFPSALHPMPRHTSCVYFLGVARTRRERGSLCYCTGSFIFQLFILSPFWFSCRTPQLSPRKSEPKSNAARRTQPALLTVDSCISSVVERGWGRGREDVWMGESPVVCL